MDQQGTGHDRVAPGQTRSREQPDQEAGRCPPRERPAGTGVPQDGEVPDVEDDDEIVPL